MSLKINLKFGGGAELLFDKIKEREVDLPNLTKFLRDRQNDTALINTEINNEHWTIKHLLQYMKTNLLREREELFLQGDTVRPGILVLVNDADWELLGESEYQLQAGDTVMFISTLHGG